MRNKILFVDDERNWIRTVGTFFKLAGYQIVTAGNTNEAVLQADGGGLGAIILDVNLVAGEDTAQLMSDLKAKHPDAPVILYTGLEREDERVQRLLEQGAEHYLQKGNLKALLKCLQDLSRKLGLIESGPRLAPAGAWKMV